MGRRRPRSTSSTRSSSGRRSQPILVVALARPELIERRPTWGAGQRDFTALHLEPLPTRRWRALLAGLVPGLPAVGRRTIVERAEGMPLYAVETFRMLLDRGRLRETSGRVSGWSATATLAVPETLQSLIAARLDALDASRAQARPGRLRPRPAFTPRRARGRRRPADRSISSPLLAALVRRELLVARPDPRSPERGQYGFVGALVREVAYGALARRDRRTRHLAAARYFEALGDDELAGVVASHYLCRSRGEPAWTGGGSGRGAGAARPSRSRRSSPRRRVARGGVRVPATGTGGHGRTH